MELGARVGVSYDRLMTSRWGYHVFGRVVPSAFFLMGFLGGLPYFPDPRILWEHPSAWDVLLIAHESLSRSMGLLLAVLFAFRKPLLGKRSGLLGAAVALAATYYGAFIIFFNALGVRTPSPHDDPGLSVLGMLLGLAGTLTLIASYTTLGRHIGIFPEVRGLVTSGPYRFLRHPMYVGYLLGSLGVLIRTISLEALLIFGCYYVLVAWRARMEEQALREYFGETYEAYRARTLGLPLPMPSRSPAIRQTGQTSSIASPKL